jgi:hypothetical protein
LREGEEVNGAYCGKRIDLSQSKEQQERGDVGLERDEPSEVCGVLWKHLTLKIPENPWARLEVSQRRVQKETIDVGSIKKSCHREENGDQEKSKEDELLMWS